MLFTSRNSARTLLAAALLSGIVPLSGLTSLAPQAHADSTASSGSNDTTRKQHQQARQKWRQKVGQATQKAVGNLANGVRGSLKEIRQNGGINIPLQNNNGYKFNGDYLNLRGAVHQITHPFNPTAGPGVVAGAVDGGISGGVSGAVSGARQGISAAATNPRPGTITGDTIKGAVKGAVTGARDQAKANYQANHPGSIPTPPTGGPTTNVGPSQFHNIQ